MISWSPAARVCATATTSYTVYAQKGNADNVGITGFRSVRVPASARHVKVTLPRGRYWTFHVAARNALGTRSDSASNR